MKHGLVDEYRLLVHPVVLGSGQRPFADGTTPAALELIGTKTTSRGVVAHIYRPSGKPEYGSAAAEQEGDVDDFTSPSLIECQQQAIIEPDKVLVRVAASTD